MSSQFLTAVSTVTDLLTVAMAYTTQAERISRMIQDAQTQNRDLTAADWATIYAQRDAARAALAQALGE